jgi:hypothetical protein
MQLLADRCSPRLSARPGARSYPPYQTVRALAARQEAFGSRPLQYSAMGGLSLWRLLALGAVVACLARPASASTEHLDYDWKLKGFGGAIIGLFFPDSGDASLVTETGPGAASTTVLELTSPHREGEFYRYGSEIGTTGFPVRVWSAYQFRGKSKMRERAIAEEEVLDFASAIHLLRRERPVGERLIRLWSDGREYPLTISPADEETVDCTGRSWTARRYVIEGRKVEGEKYWKGRFQIWLADDADATPVRIVGEKGLLTVRLELTDVLRDEAQPQDRAASSLPASTGHAP